MFRITTNDGLITEIPREYPTLKASEVFLEAQQFEEPGMLVTLNLREVSKGELYDWMQYVERQMAPDWLIALTADRLRMTEQGLKELYESVRTFGAVGFETFRKKCSPRALALHYYVIKSDYMYYMFGEYEKDERMAPWLLHLSPDAFPTRTLFDAWFPRCESLREVSDTRIWLNQKDGKISSEDVQNELDFKYKLVRMACDVQILNLYRGLFPALMYVRTPYVNLYVNDERDLKILETWSRSSKDTAFRVHCNIEGLISEDDMARMLAFPRSAPMTFVIKGETFRVSEEAMDYARENQSELPRECSVLGEEILDLYSGEFDDPDTNEILVLASRKNLTLVKGDLEEISRSLLEVLRPYCVIVTTKKYPICLLGSWIDCDVQKRGERWQLVKPIPPK